MRNSSRPPRSLWSASVESDAGVRWHVCHKILHPGWSRAFVTHSNIAHVCGQRDYLFKMKGQSEAAAQINRKTGRILSHRKRFKSNGLLLKGLEWQKMVLYRNNTGFDIQLNIEKPFCPFTSNKKLNLIKVSEVSTLSSRSVNPNINQIYNIYNFINNVYVT